MASEKLLLGHEFVAPPRGPISGDTCAKLVMRDGVAGVCAEPRAAHCAPAPPAPKYRVCPDCGPVHLIRNQ